MFAYINYNFLTTFHPVKGIFVTSTIFMVTKYKQIMKRNTHNILCKHRRETETFHLMKQLIKTIQDWFCKFMISVGQLLINKILFISHLTNI